METWSKLNNYYFTVSWRNFYQNYWQSALADFCSMGMKLSRFTQLLKYNFELLVILYMIYILCYHKSTTLISESFESRVTCQIPFIDTKYNLQIHFWCDIIDSNVTLLSTVEIHKLPSRWNHLYQLQHLHYSE